MFQWGDWWYLVYSEFTDAFQTRYRMSSGPDGPWLAPVRDSVDGRARYASKSVARDGRRFFVGWIATRRDSRDDGEWEWAGDLAVLEATQQPDGTLGFGLPRELTASFTESDAIQLDPVNGAAGAPASALQTATPHGSGRPSQIHASSQSPSKSRPATKCADYCYELTTLPRPATNCGSSLPAVEWYSTVAARPHRPSTVASARRRALCGRTRAAVPAA